jgi:hypothetical protein
MCLEALPMATTPFYSPSNTPNPHRGNPHSLPYSHPPVVRVESSEALLPPPSLHRALVARPALRIMSPGQGRALEALGHAIEYLEDRMFFGASTWSRREGDRAAIDILKQHSRAIYAGLPIRLTLWERIQQKFSEAVTRQRQSSNQSAADSRVILFPSS